MSEKKNNKKTIVAVAVLLVLVVGAIIAWYVLKPAPRDRHPEVTPAPAAVETPKEERREDPEAETPEKPEDVNKDELPEGELQAETQDPEVPEEAKTEEQGTSPAEEDLVSIVVEVTHGDGSIREFSITTAGQTLREALEQEDLIEGSDSQYGLYVTAVDGEEADSDQQQWWCFSLNGVELMTGVDSTFIADGDHYEIVLKTGW